MWENNLERDRPQMIIRRMRIACWIPKATNTHSEYVILIAFTLEQWLRERVSTLCYIACLVIISYKTLQILFFCVILYCDFVIYYVVIY